MHDQYVHNQVNALSSLIEELKSLRKEHKDSDLHVLVSDVKESPGAMQLINDKNEVPSTDIDEKLRRDIELRMYLNPTIRLIKFGMMFNTRTKLIMSLENLSKNPSLQAEIMRDSDSLYQLKHKPESVSQSLSLFVRECLKTVADNTSSLELSGSCRPHLECSNVEPYKPSDLSEIQEVNLANC